MRLGEFIAMLNRFGDETPGAFGMHVEVEGTEWTVEPDGSIKLIDLGRRVFIGTDGGCGTRAYADGGER